MIMLPARPSVAPPDGTGGAVDHSLSEASPVPSIAREALKRVFVRADANLLICLF